MSLSSGNLLLDLPAEGFVEAGLDFAGWGFLAGSVDGLVAKGGGDLTESGQIGGGITALVDSFIDFLIGLGGNPCWSSPEKRGRIDEGFGQGFDEGLPSDKRMDKSGCD